MDSEMNLSQEMRADSSNPLSSETVIEIRSGERECGSVKEINENPSDPVVPEAVIEVRSADCESVDAEGGNSKAEGNVLEKPEKATGELKVNIHLADDQFSSGELRGGDSDSDKVCRICHVSSDREQGTMDLVELGCGCRGELGSVHKHCAETWFKLKGNRCCEICGETAKNITGVVDITVIEAWNESSLLSSTSSRSSMGRCWQSHRFCNFLMVCLVIAFILPWFFRVNMF